MFHILWGQTTAQLSPGCQAVRQAMTAEGYTIQDARLDDLPSFVQTASQTRVDLLILDAACAPADVRPLDACRHLKNSPDTNTIPVIFCLGNEDATASPEEGNLLTIVSCFEMGATDVLVLPPGDCQPSTSRNGPDGQTSAERDIKLSEHLARIKAALRVGRGAHQARAAARQLDEMNNDLYERNLQVEKELYIARQLQQSLLPPFLPEPPETLAATSGMRFSKCHYRDERVRITGLYLPCDALGGDLYDVIPFADGTIGLSVADVSGHGVPAAFITAIYKSSFYRITHTHTSPDLILHDLNNELADIVKTGDYVTALYARLNKAGDDSTLSLDYSGAGHPYPIHFQAKSKQLARLQENSTPLVWVKGMSYPIGTVELSRGDKILLFTDGVSEMKNTEGQMFGEPALEDCFLRIVDQVQDELPLLDALVGHLSDFANGAALDDDLSMVLLEIL